MPTLTIEALNGDVIIADPAPAEGDFAVAVPAGDTETYTLTEGQLDRIRPQLDELAARTVNSLPLMTYSVAAPTSPLDTARKGYVEQAVVSAGSGGGFYGDGHEGAVVHDGGYPFTAPIRATTFVLTEGSLEGIGQMSDGVPWFLDIAATESITVNGALCAAGGTGNSGDWGQWGGAGGTGGDASSFGASGTNGTAGTTGGAAPAEPEVPSLTMSILDPVAGGAGGKLGEAAGSEDTFRNPAPIYAPMWDSLARGGTVPSYTFFRVALSGVGGIGGAGQGIGTGGGGGGGGGPGGIIRLAAPTITINTNAVLDVSGGNGGAGGSAWDAESAPGASGDGGSGGGGGSGGAIIFVCEQLTLNGNLYYNAGDGGTGGDGAGDGAAGGNGENGRYGRILHYTPSTNTWQDLD